MDKLKEHWASEEAIAWHNRQFSEIKRNCVFFEEFVSVKENLNGQYLLDLACGGC